MKTTEADRNMARYIGAGLGVWSITVADKAWEVMMRMKKKGLVELVPRPKGRGHYVRLTQAGLALLPKRTA